MSGYSILNPRIILIYFFSILILNISSNLASSQQTIPYQWNNVAIGGGGFVSGIITCPTEKGLAYCRTDVGGAYRWVDSTSSWIPINDDLTNADAMLQGIESVAIDPQNTNKVYIAAGEYLGQSAILRSNNKGKTWKRTNVSIRCGGNEYGRGVDEGLVVDPNQSSLLYMGSRLDGLWKSIDSAVTWKKVSGFTFKSEPASYSGITFIKFIKSSGINGQATPKIYIGVARGNATNLYYSSDTGKTWQSVPNQQTKFMPVHAAIAADTALYIAYADSTGPYGDTNGAVYRYSITSGTFTNITPPKSGIAYSGISAFPSNPNIVYASTLDGWPDEIYRSKDGGKTWKAILSTGIRHDNGFKYASVTFHWVADIEVDPFDSSRLMFVTGFGVWATNNASVIESGGKPDWYFVDKGLEETVVQGIVSPSYGAKLLCAIGDYNGFRNDTLSVPSQYGNFNLSNGTNTSIAIAEKQPSIVAIVGNTTGYYSLNQGISWSGFSSNPNGGTNGGKVAVSCNGRTIVWSSSAGSTSYTTNFGHIWTTCSGAPNVSQVTADPVNPAKFYAYDKNNIYYSVDSGATFTKGSAVSSNGRMTNTYDNEGDIWIPSSSGLYHSVNSGISFSKISGVSSTIAVGTGKGFPDQKYPSIYILGTINAITGFYRSDDTGKIWNRINDNLHNFGGVDFIVGDSRIPGRFYTASDYNGRGIIYGTPVFDCNGDSLGTASIDDCGLCTGGKTSVSECNVDCHGDLNGSANIDNCGICSGGNTGHEACVKDCQGVYGGAAFLDTCNICVGGSTGKIACGSLGIKTNNPYFKCDPNPFRTSMLLQTNEKISYKIISLSGIEVDNGYCFGSKNIGENLSDGIYLLILNNNKESSILKIVKSL